MGVRLGLLSWKKNNRKCVYPQKTEHFRTSYPSARLFVFPSHPECASPLCDYEQDTAEAVRYFKDGYHGSGNDVRRRPRGAVRAPCYQNSRRGGALLVHFNNNGVPQQLPAGQQRLERPTVCHFLPMFGFCGTLRLHAAAVNDKAGTHRRSVRQLWIEDVPGSPAAVHRLHRHDHLQQLVSKICGRGFLHHRPLAQHCFQRAAVLHHPQTVHVAAGSGLLWDHSG